MPGKETDPKFERYKSLICRQRTTVWGLCLRQTRGNTDKASDLVQEVWLTLWRYFDSLRLDCTAGQERRWVEMRTRGVLFLLRQSERRRVDTSGILTDTLYVTDAAADDRLTVLLERLSADERQIVELRLSGYSFDEIAEETGLSSLAARSRMTRIIRRMRKMAQEMSL